MSEQDPEKVTTDEPLTDADEAPDGEEPASGAGYGNHAYTDDDAEE